jgi:rsbT co-antagonist protein RsbR
MFKRLSNWLTNVSLRDTADQRQAVIFQILLIVWFALVGLAQVGIILSFLLVPQAEMPMPPLEEQMLFFVAVGVNLVASALLSLTPLVALIILRRGYFARSVLVAVSGLLLSHSMATFVLGISQPSVPVMFAVPLVLAGLLGGRRLLLTVAGTSIAVALTVGILQLQTPPLAGFLMTNEAQRANDIQVIPMTVGFLCGVIVLLTIVLERFGMTFRQSLTQALEREAELKTLRDSLERTVEARTAELSSALAEVQARAAEQDELFGQIEQQQAVIRELSIPVIPVNERTLVLPLVGSMDSARMLNLQQRALEAVENSGARTLILDVTGVALIDSQVAQGLIQTMQAAKLIGAEVALVGIRPEVAQTMVGLGVQLSMVRTFSSLHVALTELSRSGAGGQPALAGVGWASGMTLERAK